MYGVRVDWMLVDLAIKFKENHIHMKRDRIIAITAVFIRALNF